MTHSPTTVAEVVKFFVSRKPVRADIRVNKKVQGETEDRVQAKTLFTFKFNLVH